MEQHQPPRVRIRPDVVALIVEWLTVMPLGGVLALRARTLHEAEDLSGPWTVLHPEHSQTIAAPTDLVLRTFAFVESQPMATSPQGRDDDFIFPDASGKRMWPRAVLPVLITRVLQT